MGGRHHRSGLVCSRESPMALGPSDAQVHSKYEVHHHFAGAGSRDPSRPEPAPSAVYVSDETKITMPDR